MKQKQKKVQELKFALCSLNPSAKEDIIINIIRKEIKIMVNIYPKIINHVGISVPDLEKAIDFYRKVFGFDIIKGLFLIVAYLTFQNF